MDMEWQWHHVSIGFAGLPERDDNLSGIVVKVQPHGVTITDESGMYPTFVPFSAMAYAEDHGPARRSSATMGYAQALTTVQDVYRSLRALGQDAATGDIGLADIYGWAGEDADRLERVLRALGAEVPAIEDEEADDDEG